MKYKETQIHGLVAYKRHVAKLVAHERHRGLIFGAGACLDVGRADRDRAAGWLSLAWFGHSNVARPHACVRVRRISHRLQARAPDRSPQKPEQKHGGAEKQDTTPAAHAPAGALDRSLAMQKNKAKRETKTSW